MRTAKFPSGNSLLVRVRPEHDIPMTNETPLMKPVRRRSDNSFCL